jgi:amino acid permease
MAVLKYIQNHTKGTTKNNLGVLSFVLAAIGFVLIILSFINIKSENYQYYTEIAFALLIASIISGAIAKRRSKQAKTGT